MDSKINFQHLEHENSNAVISFENGVTFKISKFIETINSFLVNSIFSGLSENLKQVGLGTPPNYRGAWNTSVEAEILEPQSGEWKKGKVRMRVILEFCPDEPEEAKIDNVQQSTNSLDDIRQTILE
jgi:KGK domain